MLLEARCSKAPIRNCFGYLISAADYATHNNDFTPKSNQSGYFACNMRNSSDVINCTSQNAKLRELVIQCFQLSVHTEIILLDEKFAAASSIFDGDMILLHPVHRVLKADMIELCPDTFQDWNIFERSAAHIEEIFLHQLRLIRPGMRFVLYLSPTIPCIFYIKTASPNISSAGSSEMALFIDTDTLVTVEPQYNATQVTAENNFFNYGGIALQSFFEHQTQHVGEDICWYLLSDKLSTLRKRQFRVVPTSSDKTLMPKHIDRNSNIIVTVNNESSYAKTHAVEIECVHPLDRNNGRTCAIWIDVSAASCGLSTNSGTDDYRTSVKKVAQMLQEYNDSEKLLPQQYCWLSSALRRRGGFSDCTQIRIVPLRKNQINCVRDVTILVKPTFKKISVDELDTSKLTQQITSAITPIDSLPVLLHCSSQSDEVHNLSKYVLKLNGSTINVRLCPKSRNNSTGTDKKTYSYSYFWPIAVRYHIDFDYSSTNVNENLRKVKRPLENFAMDLNSTAEPFRFQKTLLDQIEESILGKILCHSQTPTVSYHRHILLSGSDFSGKTSILRFLALRLFHSPLIIFPCRINCREWIGLSPSTIGQHLQSAIADLSSKWPSVLFLDDFDFVEYLDNDDDEQSHFVINIYAKIFETIESNLQKLNGSVVILCAVRNENNLPSKIRFKNRGSLFSHKFGIETIPKKDQYEILLRLINQGSSQLLIDDINDLNFSIGELRTLSDRVHLQLNNTLDENSMKMVLKEALDNRPRVGQLAPQNHNRSGNVSFSTIGGHENVKKRLIEIFIWPIKYAKLYSQCGIVLRSRAILHGPSGCGKTLLMRALAAECGARFNVIFVRGPELLSKYIGDSEANVRAVFERARATSPSLLIFDEFDALAPARGHDNTGVTDRVVNQLLTELDGVESELVSAVCVIAATNRLDSIDKALLRPGRFDHKIAVLPPANNIDRAAILRCHLEDVQLASDVDIDLLAKQCVGEWSGAELRAWVLNAKLRAAAKRDNKSTNSEIIGLTAKYFWETFQESAPRFQYTANDYAKGSTPIADCAGKRITHA